MHPLVEQTIRSLTRGPDGEARFSRTALSTMQHGLARCVGTSEYAPVLEALIKAAFGIRQQPGAEPAARELLEALSAVVEISHAHGQAPDPASAPAWQAELI